MSYGKRLQQIGIATTIPMILVAGPLIGYWIGQWPDTRWGTDPWGKVGLALLGFLAGTRQVIRIIHRLTQESEGN